MISSAETILINGYNHDNIILLFDEVEKDPSKENLSALWVAVEQQKSIVETMIQLNQHKIDEALRIDFSYLPVEQSTVFILNMSDKGSLSNQDMEKLLKIKKEWLSFMEKSMMDVVL